MEQPLRYAAYAMLRLKVPLIYLRDTEGDDWKKTVDECCGK